MFKFTSSGAARDRKATQAKQPRKNLLRDGPGFIAEALEDRRLLSVSANAGGSGSVNEGSAYGLTLSASSTAGPSALTSWSIAWGDGSTTTTAGTSTYATHFYADGNASYSINATVGDAGTVSGTYTSSTYSTSGSVTVNNVAPTFSLSGPSTVNEGSVATFYRSTYSDPGQDTPTSMVIAWGDGSSSTYAGSATTFAHQYADGASYATLQATLWDEDGSYSNNQYISVANVAPTFSLTGNYSVAEGSTLTLYRSGYSDPGQDTPTSMTVDWGDGTSTGYSGSQTTYTHVFADGNAYRTVSATLSDEDGSYSTSKSVTVTNVAPTFSLSGNTSVAEGSTFTLYRSSVTDPGQDTPSSMTINWGDGTSTGYAGSATTYTHVFADGSSYAYVSATLTDEDGSHPASGSHGVSITNVAPTFTLGAIWGDPTAIVGLDYYATATNIYDPGQDTISGYSINWGDGTSSIGPAYGQFNHTYAAAGTFTMTATAIDEDGTHTYTSQTSTVTVTPVVSIEATDPTAIEPSTTAGAAVDTGLYTVTRTGTDNSSSLTVYYEIDSSANDAATNGIDYNNLNGSVTIPAGSANATFAVNASFDGIVEGDEKVLVRLLQRGPSQSASQPAAYQLTSSTAGREATVTIHDGVTIDLVVQGLSESAEEIPGAYVDINLDNDEGSSNPDNLTAGAVAADDELEAASLTLTSGATVAGNWSLDIPEAISVYRVVSGQLIEIMDGQTFAVTLSPNQPFTAGLMVEGLLQAESVSLVATFNADAGSTGGSGSSGTPTPTPSPTPAPISDKANIDVGNVLVVVISGHTQNGAKADPDNHIPDSEPSADAGIRKLSELVKARKITNVAEFSEDPGNNGLDAAVDTKHCADTLPAIIARIKTDIQKAHSKGRVLNLALAGYSHGGGLSWLVAKSLAEDATIANQYSLAFSAYYDAVKNDTEANRKNPKASEDRVPSGSKYHLSWFQDDTGATGADESLTEPKGTAVVGPTVKNASQNLDTPERNIKHSEMDDYDKATVPTSGKKIYDLTVDGLVAALTS